MDAAEPVLEMMVNNDAEQQLLFSALTPQSIVLEWGSGKSTLAIAKRCKRLYSIEHDFRYYRETLALLAMHKVDNVELFHVPRNQEEAPGHDGTINDYYDYVAKAYVIFKQLKQKGEEITVAFIDGRARVDCAALAKDIMPMGSFIFIHDYKNPVPEYRRPEYEQVETFLNHVDQAYAMAKFTTK